MPRKPRRIARDAKTGKFVSIAYAEAHPDTTVVETVEVKDRPKR